MASKKNPPLVIIAGPTASGKSALALTLAEQIGGVIVNADSAQIYRDLPILSAAPSEKERQMADHRLYRVRDGSSSCSAAEWADLARREIADVHSSGKTPILVGGTGLYLRTLLEGIAPVPPIDADVRARVRSTPLYQNLVELKLLDAAAAARLSPADTTRINRALEVVLSTGRALTDWQAERKGGIAEKVSLRPLLLLPPRDWLYRRCDDRFAQMVNEGAIPEVKKLLARNLNPKLPVMRAIGVREIGACLAGEISLDQAVAAGQQTTRRYAKRQYTWFAHQPPPEWPRVREALDGRGFAEVLAPLQLDRTRSS